MPPWAISTETTLYNKTGSWRNYRPVYTDRLPPCNNACPSGEKIQGYIDILNKSQTKDAFKKAWELLTADNPFPAICGRVCFHPCEQACNRGDYDEPIAVHTIERFIGDAGLAGHFKWRLPRISKKEKIAIIGGGPAGLSCAYHLRKLGYAPTIFEADSKLGGLLSQGIPAYRLPQNIVQAEIKRLIDTGIKVKLDSGIKSHAELGKLAEEYSVIFIAIGAHHERKLGIANEEYASVIPALEFLYNLSHNKKVHIGQTVGIIGGGNAAMDAARSVLRLGKKPIIIYRRTENEMPAIPDEIHEAKEEGIEFKILTAPQSVIVKNGKVVALECVSMKLGPPDKSGRRKPIPIPGSNFRIKLDTIIPAIGEEVDMSFLPEYLKSPEKLVKVTEDGISTNGKGIFAGGDAVTGPKTIVEALGAGKKAANLIHHYIGKRIVVKTPEEKPVAFEDLNAAYFEHDVRIQPGKSDLTKRKNSFMEVIHGYDTTQLNHEANRCFSCGVCNKCDNCFVFCPDMSVLKKGGKYEYDYEYCKGCGVCALECPRNAIALVEEKK